MTAPSTKVAALRQALADGRDLDALAIAARFPRLDPRYRRAITRGWEAHAHPRFYLALHLDPAVLVAEGVAAVRAAYGQNAS